MKDEDIQNLLGGFATDTLSDREREALFTAALHNQKLFDALADEQALRDLLSDPASRRQVLEALQPAKRGAFEWLRGWMRRPLVWAVAGCAVAALVVAIAIRQPRPLPARSCVAETARPGSRGQDESRAPSCLSGAWRLWRALAPAGPGLTLRGVARLGRSEWPACIRSPRLLRQRPRLLHQHPWLPVLKRLWRRLHPALRGLSPPPAKMKVCGARFPTPGASLPPPPPPPRPRGSRSFRSARKEAGREPVHGNGPQKSGAGAAIAKAGQPRSGCFHRCQLRPQRGR